MSNMSNRAKKKLNITKINRYCVDLGYIYKWFDQFLDDSQKDLIPLKLNITMHL